MPSNTYNYTRAAVIVHGKSEFNIVRFIYTNLHLPVKIIARDSGKTSIQINGLLDFMNKGSFKDLKKFAEEYVVEFDKRNKKLLNFKLFIIMDTDDCNENMKDKYISGKLFDDHILKNYIVPIYNIRNLEDVMLKAGIMVKKISNKDKGRYYTKIFPINTEPMSNDTVKQVETFRDKIKNLRETNMEKFIEYCFKCL